MPKEKTTITVGGREVPVTFTLGTLLSYEEIAGKPFIGETFDRFRERVALVLAAIVSADPETEVTFENIIATDNFADISAGFETVSRMATAFFEMPKVVADAEAREQPREGTPSKN